MQRKLPNGPLRNKERTKQKFLNAVGEIIKEEGYTGLGINNIAAKANVDKKLIYAYFDNVETLIETYVKQKDYWNVTIGQKMETIIKENPTFGRKEISSILENLFDQFYKSEELQKLILWEISEGVPFLRELADKREEAGSHLFKLTDHDFTNTGIDLRAILALQIAGIYYLSLHAKTNGSTFCEIDINGEEGRNRIVNALRQIVDMSYKEASVRLQ